MHSLKFEGIVLKRSDVGEKDQVITLITREKGKIVVVAKGVRSLTSSKRSSLEPGTYVKGLLHTTKTLPILSQAATLAPTDYALSSLSRIRQLSQFLEIVDRLFVEEELDDVTFEHLLKLQQLICEKQINAAVVKQALQELLEMLGFSEPETQPSSVMGFVAELTDKPMRSFEYLVVKTH